MLIVILVTCAMYISCRFNISTHVWTSILNPCSYLIRNKGCKHVIKLSCSTHLPCPTWTWFISSLFTKNGEGGISQGWSRYGMAIISVRSRTAHKSPFINYHQRARLSTYPGICQSRDHAHGALRNLDCA